MTNAACTVTMEDLLSAQFIAKKLKLSLNRKSSSLTANNLTRAFGRGMEYAESRIYQPGDDVRHIDWRLSARHDKTYTKLYHEEKGENNYIILDLSNSMHFGTSFALKSVVAAKTAAILAWLGYNEQNNIGGVIFSDNCTEFTKAKLSKNNILILFNQIIKSFTSHKQQMHLNNFRHDYLYNALELLEKSNNSHNKHNRIFIVSDFLNIHDLVIKKIEQLNYYNRVHLIRIIDPIETTKIPCGFYNITNGTEASTLNINKSNQDLLVNYFHKKLYNYFQIINNLDINNIEILSEQNWTHSLAQQLQ